MATKRTRKRTSRRTRSGSKKVEELKRTKRNKRQQSRDRRSVRKTRPRYATRPRRRPDIYKRSLDLLSDLRRGVGTYPELLRKHRLPSRTARKYLGRDLVGGTRGKPVRATKADRRVRHMFFPTANGDVPERVHGSKNATKLSDFFDDRKELLGHTMLPEAFEAKWRGVVIDGKEVFADSREIFRMFDAGELKIDDIYFGPGGAE